MSFHWKKLTRRSLLSRWREAFYTSAWPNICVPLRGPRRRRSPSTPTAQVSPSARLGSYRQVSTKRKNCLPLNLGRTRGGAERGYNFPEALSRRETVLYATFFGSALMRVRSWGPVFHMHREAPSHQSLPLFSRSVPFFREFGIIIEKNTYTSRKII